MHNSSPGSSSLSLRHFRSKKLLWDRLTVMDWMAAQYRYGHPISISYYLDIWTVLCVSYFFTTHLMESQDYWQFLKYRTWVFGASSHIFYATCGRRTGSKMLQRPYPFLHPAGKGLGGFHSGNTGSVTKIMVRSGFFSLFGMFGFFILFCFEVYLAVD